MGSNFTFKGFTNDPISSDLAGGGGGGRLPGNLSLTRQPSIYALTFDEFQSTIGSGLGKDFGSMNMDELLKNIWSAEETQTMAAAGSFSFGGSQFQEGLQRQGSLTLPRTLSQKTVDEVWKDISKESLGGSGVSNGGGGAAAAGGPNLTQRQQTLGEMTLEEFLVRAGVVREDDTAQLGGKVVTNGGYFGNSNPAGLAIGFQQNRGVGFSNTANSNGNNTGQVSLASADLPLSVNGLRSNHVQPQVQTSQPQQQQQIFPKQTNLGYVTQVATLQSTPGFTGMGDQGIGTGLMPGGGAGMVGLGGIVTGSPANQLSSDGIEKSNGDISSVSPVPFVFNGGLRGRRASGAVEKVVERRQRRMIKNRESAARSRARKQAYTTELEADVAKLKEENAELRKKQEELMELQKNQVMEMMTMQPQGVKKRCLRRSHSGPW